MSEKCADTPNIERRHDFSSNLREPMALERHHAKVRKGTGSTSSGESSSYNTSKMESDLSTQPSFASQAAQDFNGAPKLGYRGAISLMHELSKGVHRLKDDLFVMKFANSKSFLDATSVDSDGVKKLRDLSSDTTDPDDLLKCPLLDSRRTFLEVCQHRSMQFDSIRRAKYSSLVLLHYLNNPFSEDLRVHCCACKRKIKDIRWHCEKCMDIDLCNTCNFNPQSVAETRCHLHERVPIRVSFT